MKESIKWSSTPNLPIVALYHVTSDARRGISVIGSFCSTKDGTNYGMTASQNEGWNKNQQGLEAKIKVSSKKFFEKNMDQQKKLNQKRVDLVFLMDAQMVEVKASQESMGALCVLITHCELLGFPTMSVVRYSKC